MMGHGRSRFLPKGCILPEILEEVRAEAVEERRVLDVVGREVAKMQGSTSPLLLMWMYLRPPDRQPPVRVPSPQKSATRRGRVFRMCMTPRRS